MPTTATHLWRPSGARRVVLDGFAPAGPGDLTLTQTAVDGAIAILWLAGGQIGTTYSVTLTIGTSNGRTISRIVLLPVQSLATAPAVLNALQTNTGAVITDQSGNPILIGS